MRRPAPDTLLDDLELGLPTNRFDLDGVEMITGRVGPAVITIGSIHGGVRANIIPDRVELEGTLRMYDERVRKEMHERIERTAEHVTAAAGATAEVVIDEGKHTNAKPGKVLRGSGFSLTP